MKKLILISLSALALQACVPPCEQVKDPEERMKNHSDFKDEVDREIETVMRDLRQDRR